MTRWCLTCKADDLYDAATVDEVVVILSWAAVVAVWVAVAVLAYMRWGVTP